MKKLGAVLLWLLAPVARHLRPVVIFCDAMLEKLGWMVIDAVYWFYDILKPVFTPILRFLDFVKRKLEEAAAYVWRKVRAVVLYVWGKVRAFAAYLWGKIKSFAVYTKNKISKFIKLIKRSLRQIIRAILRLLKAIITPVAKVIKRLIPVPAKVSLMFRNFMKQAKKISKSLQASFSKLGKINLPKRKPKKEIKGKKLPEPDIVVGKDLKKAEAQEKEPLLKKLTRWLKGLFKKRKKEKKVIVKKKGSGILSMLKGMLKGEGKKPEKIARCINPKYVDVASGGVMRIMNIDCMGCPFSSGLSDSECRYQMTNKLGGNYCQNLVLNDGYYQKEYDQKSTSRLHEISEVSESMNFVPEKECGICGADLKKKLDAVKEAIKRDPVKACREGFSIEKNTDIIVEGIDPERCKRCEKELKATVEKAKKALKETELIKVSERLENGKTYEKHLTPTMRPFFSNSRVSLMPPEGAKLNEEYNTNGSEVGIYQTQEKEELYLLKPPEYKLAENQLKIMRDVYDTLLEEAPGMIIDSEGEHVEEHFRKLCRSEVRKAASKEKIELSEKDITELVEILVRCTMGLDVIETMLKDQNLQDVYINSPVEKVPIYVKHKDYDDCRTNVFVTEQATKNIISKFRLKSGRAFSEVSPILDMELPSFGVRVNITGPPISPDGLAFAFRRSSEMPWTLLRFIENKMISPMAAGFLGFMVNEESTILMCGDRGSGKTSMLTALVGAMPTKYRILTLEDTFEIPVPVLASEGGFRIQRMRVKPPTSAKDSFEMGTDDAMRSLLRMGDSAIVMGEVRGPEAKTLYEAMNVGGSGNCVLGTIHGKSPRNLFERVVFSLGVPPQSFKATDLVVMATRVRPQGGSKKLRRVIEIAEVGKNWTDPSPEKVFKTLMKYDSSKDMLVPSETLLNPKKSEVLSLIADKRGSTPEQVLQDIKCRGRVYEYIVETARKTKNKRLLEMSGLVENNKLYRSIIDQEIRKGGEVDYDKIYDEWKLLFDARVKSM